MRPTLDRYFIDLARLIATRSTCLRRAVGCVLVDARGHVLATGYNGVAAGLPHCNELQGYDVIGDFPDKGQPDVVKGIYPYACAGAAAASGERLEVCEAIHAEQNALLQCRDVYAIDAAYVTVSPCLTCIKLLMNTACHRIVFIEAYAPQHDAARALWERAGRSWGKLVQ